MRATFAGCLRRPLIAATVMSSILAWSSTSVGAASVTTTTQVATTQSTCGVVASPAVHFVSKVSPCVIRVRVGTYVHVKFRSGFHWSYPMSNSRTVVVTTISRSSIGVNAATFHAAAIGHATIRATGTIECKSGLMCPDLILLWSLKVIVT